MLTRVFRFLEFDREFWVIFLGRVLATFCGFFSVLIITSKLNPIEQGYYYTFNSLISLQSIFELGLFSILMTFSSHESGNVYFDSHGCILGESRSRFAILGLARAGLKYYSVISSAYVLLISIVGYAFFIRNAQGAESVNWLYPWIFYVLSSGLLLCVLPLTSIIEGCNKVYEINLLKLFQSLCGYLVLWIIIYLGGSLWASISMTFMSFLVGAGFYIIRYRGFLLAIFKEKFMFKINWKDDVWPLQWRLAVACLASFFMFNAFNPILFSHFGPESAGKMGVTINVITAIQSLGFIWVTKNIPNYGRMIAERNYESLDRTFKKNVLISMIVTFLGLVSFISLVFFGRKYGIKHAYRFTNIVSICIFSAGTLLLQYSMAQSSYIRAHKQEPLLVMSLVSGAIIAILAYFLGKIWAEMGISLSWLIGNVIILPWVTYILRKGRVSWQMA